MKPPSRKPTLTAGLVACFFAALAAGWHLGGTKPAPPDDPDSDVAPVGSRSNADRAGKNRGMADSAKRRMAALRAISDPRERLRATHALACSLTPSELAKWLQNRWFDAGPGFDLALFNKLARQRLRDEDPDAFLALAFREDRELAVELLTKMAGDDPAHVLALLRKHPDPEMEMRMLGGLARSNPELALEMLLKSPGVAGDNGIAGSYRFGALGDIARKCPNELEAALSAMPLALRKQAEALLIGARLAGSFGTEIRKLWERSDGWLIFETAVRDDSKLGAAVVDELANLPPSWRKRIAENPGRFISKESLDKWAATDLEAAGFTKKQAANFRNQLAFRLASGKPETVIQMVNGLETGEIDKRTLLIAVFSGLRTQPEKAESLLAMLASDNDRKTARTFLMPYTDDGSYATEAAPVQQIEQPADWLAQVAEAAGAKSGMGSDYLSMLATWDAARISNLATQFRDLPNEQKRNIAGVLASDQSSYPAKFRPIQAEAIRYLLANPAPPAEGQPNTANGHAFEASRLAVSWVADDPAAATEWVGNLPAGEAKQTAQKNLAANWWKYDPKAVERWIAGLPAAERDPVREFIKQKTAP